MEPPPLDELLALPTMTINLEYADSADRICNTSPVERYKTFIAPSPQIEGHGFLELNVSVLVLPDDLEKDWFGTPDSYWMRQKIRKATKLGYEFAEFDFRDHVDEIYEINTSKEERQGRAMSESYTRRPAEKSPFRDQTCVRHRNDYYGIFRDGRLYAYAMVRQVGEMFIFSEFIGHGDHLDNGVMSLLTWEASKIRHAESNSRLGIYHLHHNGTPGLQFFKRKMGFRPFQVHWELAKPGVELPDLENWPPKPPPAPRKPPAKRRSLVRRGLGKLRRMLR